MIGIQIKPGYTITLDSFPKGCDKLTVYMGGEIVYCTVNKVFYKSWYMSLLYRLSIIKNLVKKLEVTYA